MKEVIRGNRNTVEFALNTSPPWSRFWLLTRGWRGVFKAFLKKSQFWGVFEKVKKRLLQIGPKQGGVFKKWGGYLKRTSRYIKVFLEKTFCQNAPPLVL